MSSREERETRIGVTDPLP